MKWTFLIVVSLVGGCEVTAPSSETLYCVGACILHRTEEANSATIKVDDPQPVIKAATKKKASGN